MLLISELITHLYMTSKICAVDVPKNLCEAIWTADSELVHSKLLVHWTE